MKKARVIITALFTIIIMSCCTYAESTANKNAKNAYEKYVNVAKNSGRGYFVAYKDITGDGVVEMLLSYHPECTGSGYRDQLFTYKNGKAKKLYQEDEYGLDKLTRYSNGLVCHGAGHGNEWYKYYKMSGGKYKLVAMKARTTNGKWNYSNGKGTTYSKSKFSSIKNEIKTGKARSITSKDMKFVW